MIAIVLLLTVATIGLVKYILYINHLESYVKHVRHVKPSYPFIGNLLLLIGKSTKELFEIFVKTLENGTPVKSYLAAQLYMAIDEPDDVKAVLTSSDCLDKPFIYDYVPHGLLAEKSKKNWIPMRSALKPMLNLKLLQSLIPMFNEKTKILVAELSKLNGSVHFNILPLSNLCAFNAICSTAMGIDLSRDEGMSFMKSMETLFHLVIKRIASPWNRIDFIYCRTNLCKEIQKHFDTIRSFVDRGFKKHENTIMTKKGDNPKQNIDQLSKSFSPTFISLFAETQFDEEMIKNQIEGILSPGYETTGATFAYAILLLAMHPSIQHEVFIELQSIYESQDENTTYEHINKLQLLNRIIKETLRLFPAAPFIARTATVDTPISNCIIPKDTYILVSLFTLHRRHDVWGKDADEFNPDHFLPENDEKRHSFGYLPFSGGLRNCIGYKYALFSLVVMLSATLRNYKFTTDLTMSQLSLKSEVILKLLNGHMVKLERLVW